MADIFKFDPAQHRWPDPEPLNNTERQLLQDMAQPGLPLWKVLRQLFDYREELIISFSQPGHDLEDEGTRKAMRKTQAAIGGLTQVIEMINQALCLEERSEGNE